MPQTFYIEADEEIISVIGRLRKSSAEENVFVFPKRALVLQSIINLRLFQREAEKLGKRIVIVSQDEVGKMLAEKAGIETENYSEDFSKKASHLELTAEAERVPVQTISAPAVQPGALRSDAIGSSNFYATEVTAAPSQSLSAAEASVMPLRIRNATPPKLTSLNSKRFEGITPQALPKVPELTPTFSAPLPSAQAFTPESDHAPRGGGYQEGNNERLKNFYGSARKASPAPAPSKALGQGTVPITGKKAHKIFFLVGGISLLSVIGVVLFFFLPKAEIQVTPYAITQTTDVEMDGRSDIIVPGDGTLPVRILEKEKEITLTIATTGKSGGTNQKARGTVVIYNNYSADSQPLVATTRLETADGKLFRLLSGVVVPGMTNTGGQKEPGAIEASVVADQTGAEYNIDATTFTIPGFKGGPKYSAFSARSSKTMAGGGSGGVADVAVVAKVDLETADREAKEKAKEAFLSEIRSELSPDERALDEQMDILASTPATLPQIGTAANAFDYKVTFKIRVFVFSEKTVKEKAEALSEKNLQGIQFKPVSSTLTYSDSVPDFSAGTLRLKARALVAMESDINRDKLQAALLGKSEDGIKEVLKGFPEVKKIKVVFHPELFMRTIPSSASRVFVLVEPGEKME